MLSPSFRVVALFWLSASSTTILWSSSSSATAWTVGSGSRQPARTPPFQAGRKSIRLAVAAAAAAANGASSATTTTVPDAGLTTSLEEVDIATTGSSFDSDNEYNVVNVDLSDGRSYPIYIGSGFSDQKASELLRSHIKGKKVLIVTNDRIDGFYLERYKNILLRGNNDDESATTANNLVVDTLVVPDGEEHKSMDVLNLILQRCLELRLDRQATLVALGGGVIGDMVGFAAAVYQRGIAFVQIPTTVMSMVDSSVGGKTGVNHALGKNMIGAFHQPACVWMDTETLQTLPDRELQSGIAEIIKYGLIRDAAFLAWQERHMAALCARDPATVRTALARSCENKAAVVQADEFEAGVRATLNLGHTFGHAIETGSGYGTWLHGEAVAIGTCMAATMSAKLGWIEPALVQRIYDILHAAKLPTELPPSSPMTRELFLELMAVDKKVANGKLRLILLQGELGNCVFTGDFDEQAMMDTIDEFVAECQGPAKE